MTTGNGTENRSNKRRIMTAAAVAVSALLVGTVLFGAVTDSNGTSFLQSDDPREAARADASTAAEQAIADMEALAQAAAEAAVAAGAEAEAEFDATSSAASGEMDRATAQAEAEVDQARRSVGGLQAAPEGYSGGEVTPSANDHQVPAYEYRIHASDPASDSRFQVGNITIVEAPFEGRAEFNLPSTGNELLDAQVRGVIGVYLNVLATLKQNGNGTAAACDDDSGCVVWEHGEGRATYAGSPDGERADMAAAHARMLMDNSEAALRGVLSGVQAEVDVQASLLAEAEAEINATIESEAEARASIQKQMEQRVNATWQAEAGAEAEAHAKAQQQVEATQAAKIQAKRTVRAAAEQQASMVWGASVEAAERLEGQAGKAIEQGDQAAAQIHANAAAAAAAVAKAGSAAGIDTSGEAEAIMAASAQAEAQARANAQARADALMQQAANVRAYGGGRADMIIAAAAEAEAAIDARADVAIKVILRAEAYTVAKAKARAQAQVDAHVRAAAIAEASLEGKTKSQIRAIVSAALSANAAAEITFDGSKDFTEMVSVTTEHEVDKDIHYVREVAADYEYRRQFDQNTEADHYEDVANQLEVEKEVITEVTHEIDSELDYGYWVVANTAKDLSALGQKWL